MSDSILVRLPPNTSEQSRMLQFALMRREEQAQAIRRLANSGYTETTIAAATGLSVEMVRRVLAETASE